ncbi:MAG: thiamine biosynthesis protein ThiI [Dehalococcoidia bacterium]|nr:thiamine biosynthesis protein ThiI [Dehalococcoidia bacterium]
MNHSKNLVVVRVHEIALKGKNRPLFFDQLVRNLREALRGTGVDVQRRHLRVEITLGQESVWDDVRDRLRQVFGVVKFYRCHKLSPSLEAIKEFLSEEMAGHTFGSFRITSRRGDKSFPLTSPQLNREIGAYVQQLIGARVDLLKPGVNIFVEILPGEALVYFQEEAGPGGLPVGVSGKVVALLSGGIDSPVAAWRMMKRGCQVILVHFHSFPLLEGTSREKAVELAEMLNRYQLRSTLFLVPFADVQKEIVLSVPPAYRIIIYRRFMARIAERIAREQGAKALVTGESLGQVGSQTLENLVTIRSAVELTIFSPLIGMDKQEIIDEARRLGTYPISIIPDEDCCTLFTPRHPATRSTPEEVERLESSLDIPALVERAVAQAEVRRFATEKAVKSAIIQEPRG